MGSSHQLPSQIGPCNNLMLIVNADDWGRSEAETNAALDCHERGTVTSVSAMVFMKDSDRAASIARIGGVDVGLHLNLTEEFASEEAPAQLRQAQGRIARFLRRNKYTLLLYHPGLRQQFSYVYGAQADEFRRLYGADPSHVDGHLHMHHCTNMMIDRIIPKGQRVRRNFSFGPGEKGVVNRTYRGLADLWLGRRYRLTDFFFSLEWCLKTGNLLRIMELAKTAIVELMTHPIYPAEHAFLTGEVFESLLEGVAKGTRVNGENCPLGALPSGPRSELGQN
jgi:chitin disaccharide deacetylase